MESSLVPFNKDLLSKLETYEDYLSFYIQLDQTSSAFAWLKADLLLQMSQQLGESSLEQLSRDLNEKKSTVTNYIRTARAFPTDLRDPMASFSIHFKASFADSYNDQTKEFEGEERFEWVRKAVERELSTRDLSDAIWMDKTQKLLGQMKCTMCHSSEGQKFIKMYNFMLSSPQFGGLRDRLMLHDTCYNNLISFLYGENDRS